MGRNINGKRSMRQKLQDFMSTVNGQIVLNYAYNWGASVVILGALFKLIHLPGANTMLCVGMGTEVLIFFISAFDLSGVKRGDGGKPSAAAQPQPIVTATAVGRETQTEVSTAPMAASSMPAAADNGEVADYLDQLRRLTSTLEHCTEQAQYMAADSEEVHEQTRRMAQQLKELNSVYARMLQAMTTNNNHVS